MKAPSTFNGAFNDALLSEQFCTAYAVVAVVCRNQSGAGTCQPNCQFR